MNRLVSSALLCLLFAMPAFSQDALHEKTCQFPYDAVAAEFAAAGSPVAEIGAEDLPKIVTELEAITGQKYPNVTRGFVASAGGQLILGFESNDCLLPPVIIGNVLPERLSGRDGNRIGA